MNKKGLESIPFVIFISVLVIMFVIVLFSNQMLIFSDFREKNEFYGNIKTIVDTMKNLRSTSDFGSFKMVEFNIPTGYSIIISKEKITTYENNRQEKNISFIGEGINITGIKGFNITNELNIIEGKHKLQIFYGEPRNLKDWMISYK